MLLRIGRSSQTLRFIYCSYMLQTLQRERLQIETRCLCGIQRNSETCDFFDLTNEKYISSRCLSCGHERRWERWVKPEKMKEPGQQCRKCLNFIVKQESKRKPRKAGQEYYFSHYLKCLGCKTIYMDDKYKIYY